MVLDLIFHNEDMSGQVSVIFFEFSEDNLGAKLFGCFFIDGFVFTEDKIRDTFWIWSLVWDGFCFGSWFMRGHFRMRRS